MIVYVYQFLRFKTVIVDNYKPYWNENTYVIMDEEYEEDLKKAGVRYSIIDSELKKNFLDGCANSDEATVKLRTQINSAYVEFFKNTLSELNRQEKITAVITTDEYTSLQLACEAINIPFYNIILSAIRNYEYTPYSKTLMVISSCWRRDYMSIVVDMCRKRYNEFKKISNELPLMSRKELLKFVLKSEYYNEYFEQEFEEKYELGIVLNPNWREVITEWDNKKILSEAYHKKYQKEEYLKNGKTIAVREHPLVAGEIGSSDWYELDKTPCSLEFAARCKCVVSGSSNLLFEALLFGKEIITLEEHPYRVIGAGDFEDNNNSEELVEFLNFFVFCYCIPIEKAFDEEFIKKVIHGMDEEELYRCNMDFLMTK